MMNPLLWPRLAFSTTIFPDQFVFLFTAFFFVTLFTYKQFQLVRGNNTLNQGNNLIKEDQLRFLLKSSHYGFAEIRDEIIIDADENFASIFEYELDKLTGKSIAGIILRERVEDQDTSFIETIGKTATGKILNLEILQDPIPHLKPKSQFILVRDITQRKREEEELKQLALYDPVTNLYNRAQLLKQLTSRLESPRKNMQTSLLFVDLDNFKLVNDGHGHEMGDELLKAVGKRLEKVLRSGDTVARYGGDEFVILFDYPIDGACTIAQRILSVVQSPYILNGVLLHITVSIGIVRDIQKYEDIKSVLHAADQAMYQAKNNGKNQFSFAMAEKVQNI